MANYRGGRGHPKQFQTPGADVISLAAKKPKKRQWKVKVQPEVDEDDEEEYKEVSYVKPQFDNEKVYQLIEETVDKVFLPTMPEVEEGQEAEPQPYVYNPNDNANLCQRLSKEIRDSLKTWRSLQRHRIIVQVSVVEKNHQGIHVKMKFLVDAEKDNYVKYYLDNPNFFIIVNAFFIYQD